MGDQGPDSTGGTTGVDRDGGHQGSLLCHVYLVTLAARLALEAPQAKDTIVVVMVGAFVSQSEGLGIIDENSIIGFHEVCKR